MVIAALERGYFPNRDPTPLGTSDWARLSCDLLAAIGRGYHRQFTTDQETALERVRMQATDPSPLSNTYPTFFHRLSATAEQDFTEKATKAAAAEVDEKWLTWKANEIDRLALTFKKDLGIKARERGKNHIIEVAEKLGLQILWEGTPTPTAGRKRTVSGSATETTQPTPTSTPQATRDSLPRAAKKTSSYSPAPRGRQPTPSPQPTAWVDPSPTPRPKKKKSPVTLGSNQEGDRPAQLSLPEPMLTSEQPDAAALTATVLTKILTCLEALERLSMPPPRSSSIS
ncbi:hypothetical protein V8E52_005486 [Russula decolorans]